MIRFRARQQWPHVLPQRVALRGVAVGTTVKGRPHQARSANDTLASDTLNDTLASDTLQSIGDSLVTTDLAGRIKYLNPVAERLTGWSLAEAAGKPLETVMILRSEATGEPIASIVDRCLREGRAIDLEDGVVLIRRDGTEIAIGDSAAPIRNVNGKTLGVVLVIQDESEKRRVGHRLSYEAAHDGLTGLINWREFERQLTRLIAGLRDASASHILLYLDLDRFKLVNDTFGHDAGDALLRSLGPVIGRHLRPSDTLARLGGDEFGVLLKNCPLHEGNNIADNIREAVEEWRFDWANAPLSVGASIGLLHVTEASGDVAAIMRAVDAACYSAKAAGGGRVHEFSSRRNAIPVLTAQVQG